MTPRRAIRQAGLVGGVGWARPGELSLAQRGVLFLDELPEFGHQVLEVMRQPLEDGVLLSAAFPPTCHCVCRSIATSHVHRTRLPRQDRASFSW